jgi:hypothetical protein
VGAEDLALVERPIDLGVSEATRAQAERPFRAAIVLRLNGAQPGDDVRRRRDRRIDELVIGQTIADQIARQRPAGAGQESVRWRSSLGRSGVAGR